MSAFQCVTCGVKFEQMLDYYRHRIAQPDGGYLCMPQEQMPHEGVKTSTTPVFDPSKSIIKVTPPRPRGDRPETQKKLAPEVLHAKWLLTHGKKLDDLRRLGMGENAINKAVISLSDEMRYP